MFLFFLLLLGRKFIEALSLRPTDIPFAQIFPEVAPFVRTGNSGSLACLFYSQLYIFVWSVRKQ